MIVRRAELGDLPDIIELARGFHEESPHHNFLPFDPGAVYQLVTTAIGNDDWLPVVAYASGGALVGMGLFFALPTFFGPALEAGDLAFYVRPDRRGSVAAGGIMRELMRWASAKGVRVIRQGVNTGIAEATAERFFEGSGFSRAGSIWMFRPPLDPVLAT